jgi:hypothetical protein
METVAGQTSQHKMISVVGLQPGEAEKRLFGGNEDLLCYVRPVSRS